MVRYTDETIMPFGIHKDKKLANVPADYLMGCYDNNKVTEPLRKYIEENLDVLRAEEKNIKSQKKLDYKQTLK